MKITVQIRTDRSSDEYDFSQLPGNSREESGMVQALNLANGAVKMAVANQDDVAATISTKVEGG